MKNNKKIISALIAVMSLGMSSIPVCADSNTTGTSNTTTGTAKTRTGVAVKAGTLSIDHVPFSFDFSSSVDEIANGSTVTAGTIANDGIILSDGHGKIFDDGFILTDGLGYGANTNWTLSATPSKLSYTDSNKISHNLPVSCLDLDGQTPITALDGTTETPVATGTNEGKHFGFALDGSNLRIHINKDPQVFAQNYTGTITWTLTDSGGTTSAEAK